jgi:hypothetical protein
MSEEKQIEEMKRDLKSACISQYNQKKCTNFESCKDCQAAFLYTAGYRKQSEVIDEFVERIKNEFSAGISVPSDYVEIQYILFCEIIDKLAIEMKGGE